jgi:hypothetical protein
MWPSVGFCTSLVRTISIMSLLVKEMTSNVYAVFAMYQEGRLKCGSTRPTLSGMLPGRTWISRVGGQRGNFFWLLGEGRHSRLYRRWRPPVRAQNGNRHGETNVNRIRWGRRVAGEGDEYVSKEEFVGVFESEQVGLQRLALLLTANSDAAAQCLSLALQQCLATSFVFKGWALSWMRRVVISSAISLVMGSGQLLFVKANGEAEKTLTTYPEGELLVPVANVQRILGFSQFDRFVFVICVLERYSVHDCAALLGRSLRDINDSLQRTNRQLEDLDDFGNRPLQVAVR